MTGSACRDSSESRHSTLQKIRDTYSILLPLSGFRGDQTGPSQCRFKRYFPGRPLRQPTVECSPQTAFSDRGHPLERRWRASKKRILSTVPGGTEGVRISLIFEGGELSWTFVHFMTAWC